MRHLPIFCAVALLGLVGCSSIPSVGGDISGNLGDAQGTATAPWMALDLDTGTYAPLATPGDTAAAQWRDRYVLFRRVGSADNPAYLAIFEVTQAQWVRLGGGTPWMTIPGSIVDAVGIAGDRPAYGLSWTAIQSTLAAWNTGRSFQIAAPSESEWQTAASGGTWTWGEAWDRTTVRDRALVFETLNPLDGAAPDAVGERLANGLGFHDLVGNVWEWCSPGTALRGGSWRDGVWAGRSSNRLSFDDAGVDSAADHALFGVRLALRP